MSTTNSNTKLLVIIGITGNQGHSVATRFLKDTTYRIRGITRNTTSAVAKSLADQGVELITADLNDPSTLTKAFSGANLVFSVTNYWEPFFSPDGRRQAAEKGVSPGRHAYDVEKSQGINIADAVATTVDTLDENGFVVSTLSNAKVCSGGKAAEAYHFHSKAEVFPDYVNEKYPKLAAKMSCVQTGYFMTSWQLIKGFRFDKQSNDEYLIKFPHNPHRAAPFLDVNADVGPFVYAVSQMTPGKQYMIAGTTCTWPEYAQTWSKVTGKKCEFKQIDIKEIVNGIGDPETGREIGDMFVYSGDFGYDGGDKKEHELLGYEDLRKAGLDVPMTSLEDYCKRQDWSAVLNA